MFNKRNEIWKDVVGYEGIYRVSSLGRVLSLERTRKNKNGYRKVCERILRAYPNKAGRLRVSLRNGMDKPIIRFVYHLVLEAFVGPRPKGTEACHYPDRCLSNNRLDNLKWGTKSENSRHAVIHGTCSILHYKRTKINQDIANRIRSLYATGKYSQRELGDVFGVSFTTIKDIYLNRRWVD